MLQHYLFKIKDKQERIELAIELRKLMITSETYIPGQRKADIGINGTVCENKLKQIEALIERRGYDVKKRKSQN
tara:strand:+ start:3105 stop:3326 length:222 start_codon:yes stop_codon:yes gene_type:complete